MQHSVVTPVVNDGTCTNTSSSGRRLCRLRRRSGAPPRPPRADVFDSIAAFTIPYIAQLASQQEAIMSSGPRQWRSTPSRDPALLTLAVRCAPYERRSIRHHRQYTRTPCAYLRAVPFKPNPPPEVIIAQQLTKCRLERERGFHRHFEGKCLKSYTTICQTYTRSGVLPISLVPALSTKCLCLNGLQRAQHGV
jgi:hypothetical protein